MSKNSSLLNILWVITFVFLVGSTYYYFRGIKPQGNNELPTDTEQPVNVEKTTFITGAEKILTAAMAQYELELTSGSLKEPTIYLNGSETPNAICYVLLETGLASAGPFKGHVIIDMTDAIEPLFYLALTDTNYQVKYTTLTTVIIDDKIIEGSGTEDFDICPVGILAID